MRNPLFVLRAALGMLAIAAALSGCGMFVTHYDAAAYQNFTNLKAYHLKFIDDFGPGKAWDEAAVKRACDAGELRFREAKEYAAGKNDESRVRAVGYLHDLFSVECRLSLKTGKPFGEAYAAEEKKQAAANYDWAVKGELARVGAPAQ